MITCRLARSNDLEGIVAVFQGSEPESVWSQMGNRVAREYFNFYLSSPDEVLVVAVREDVDIVGFCMGTGRPAQYPSVFYREHAFSLIAALVQDLWDHPGIIIPIIRRFVRGFLNALCNIRPRQASNQLKQFNLSGSICYLAQFAVSPDARGNQIGTLLAGAFLCEMEKLGFAWCTAVTTNDNLASQVAMQRAGFHPEPHTGKGMTFIRQLFPEKPNPLHYRVETSVFTDLKLVRDLANEYSRLWDLTPEISAFQSFEWILNFWDTYSEPDKKLFVIVFSMEERPVAIFLTELLRNGVLSFIASNLSNYSGPVFDPRYLEGTISSLRVLIDASSEIRGIDFSGIKEHTPFYAILRSLCFERFGKCIAVQTSRCPEVDLRPGWTAILAKRASKQRSNWRRKWRSLEQLGQLEFVETYSPQEISLAFPKLIDLYDARWQGKRVLAVFSEPYAPFQLRAARALGQHNLVCLSLLKLEGEIIAFSYNLRGNAISTSYVLAHDARFESFSPGLLLLLKLLEAAANRGDSRYDFSLGETPYKALWASEEQRIFSLFWGPNRKMSALISRLRTATRGVPLLKRFKQDGLGLLFDPIGKIYLNGTHPTVSDRGVWHVYKIIGEGPDRTDEFQPLSYQAMRKLFPPRMLALALDRHYRGDQALCLTEGGQILAVVWKAMGARKKIVTGGITLSNISDTIYYHPIGFTSESNKRILSVLNSGNSKALVSPVKLSHPELREIYRFRTDLHFRRKVSHQIVRASSHQPV